MTTLTQIGKEEFTEKVSHGFLDIYEEIWEDKFDRNSCISLLEIGIYNGNSLKVWDRWFFCAQIIGIDKYAQPIRPTLSDRVHIKSGDQTDPRFLKEVSEEHGPFDIIIDDGGHHWSEQQTSLFHLWPKVKSGGMYIIEDLHTSNDSWWRGEGSMDTASYLSEEARFLAMGKPSYDDVYSYQFFNKLAVIRKK